MDETDEAALVAALPKVELHCHLDGIVDPEMLRTLRTQGHDVPVDAAALVAASPVRSFDDWQAWGRVARPLEGDLTAFEPILAVHVDRLRRQRVDYAEVMISPSEVPPDPAQAVERVGAFRAALDALCRRDHPAGGTIQVELLMALNRGKGPERVAAQASTAVALYDAGLIAGVTLAGVEQGHPVRPMGDTFARLRETGMGIEIHAGEWCGAEAVWDALEHGFPDRIGHGVRLFDDPRLVDLVRERGIHLEFCPTSNVITGAIERLEQHPIRRARDLGLSFSLNTDDPGPFACSMVSEYALVARLFGFTTDDFERIRQNALAAAFGPRSRRRSDTG